MTKDELIELTKSEHAAIEAAIADAPEDDLTAPAFDGGWSLKDAIAHIIKWEGRIMRAVTAADRGEEVVYPEPRFEMHETDRLNKRGFADFHAWVDAFSEEQVAGELPYTPDFRSFRSSALKPMNTTPITSQLSTGAGEHAGERAQQDAIAPRRQVHGGIRVVAAARQAGNDRSERG